MANPAGERFWALYEPNSRLLTSIAYRLLRDADAARDVLQDSVVKALRGFSRLRDPERFVPWMSAIVAHEAHAWLRKNKRKTEKETPEEHRLFPAEDDLLEQVLHDETRLLLKDAIGGLSPEDRMILYLRFYGDMKHREIALLMDMTPDAVRMRLRRMLKRLKNALGEDG